MFASGSATLEKPKVKPTGFVVDDRLPKLDEAPASTCAVCVYVCVDVYAVWFLQVCGYILYLVRYDWCVYSRWSTA